MKIKKIISLVLASVMIASSIPMMAVQAADAPGANNLVVYTPVEGIQEVPENNMIDNGGFDFYFGSGDEKNHQWWMHDGLEITNEDYITMGPNEFSTEPEGYSLKCDMKNLAQDSIAIAGSFINLEDFPPEQTVKFTFYMKCNGDSAAEELSTINIYGMKGTSEEDRVFDLKLTDPLGAYSHQTPGVQDGWVRVDCYIEREDILYAGPMELHVLFAKGPDRNADNVYFIDGMSLELISEEDVPTLTVDEKPIFQTTKITPTTKEIRGNHLYDGATVTVKAGSKVLGTTDVIAKTFVVKFKAQKPGTKVSVIFTKAGYEDYTEEFVVGLPKIKVNKVTSKSKKITGKAYAKAQITVKAGKKVVAKGKAKANGKFSLKLKKVKKKTTLKITAKLGAATATASYKVKK